MLCSSLLIISLTLFALFGVTPARAADGIAWQARHAPVQADQDAGYVPAARMISVLEHILSDPNPITYHESLFDQLEYGLLRARQGDATTRRMAQQTLEGSLKPGDLDALIARLGQASSRVRASPR